jgi:hypothetical protein
MTRSAFRRMLASALLFAGLCSTSHAFMEGFIDPQDGYLDMSNWLVERKGFLPVPIVITEPAVGYGGGLTLMFVRNSIRESAARAAETGHMVPPDIFVAGAAGTENGTRVAFGGGMMSFDDDHWRWRGAVARTDVNLEFYGLGGALDGVDRSLSYSLDGWMSVQRVMRRLGDGNTWLGGRWIYLDFDNKLALDGPLSRLLPDEMTQRSSGLGLVLEHDTRDNIFTPNKGWIGALDLTFYEPSWGSDTRFQSYRGHAFGYWPIAKTLVLAGRADVRAVRGDVPFYQVPFIDLRGVPAQRYQDQNTAVLEAELRWNVTPRWAAIGFVGTGRAWGRRTDFSEGDDVLTKGVGFRYLLARQLGLWAGLDYARGPEEDVFYIQVGSAWR